MGWTVQGGALRRVGCLGRDPNWAVGHPDFFPSLVASVLSFSMWSLQGWGLDPYMVAARGSPEGAFLGEEAEPASHAWKWHRGSSTALLVNAAGWVGGRGMHTCTATRGMVVGVIFGDLPLYPSSHSWSQEEGQT